ncbi:MAG: MFS transporter, partial [Spirochaetes bacterium]|nr:MFS transporter [Candidatus Aphodenecus pullistercoris]
YAVSLAGALLGTSATVRFAILTLGYMGANFGQYGLYLIAMISILNTVEYNEWKNGTRDEAIIASLRPFFTKLASAITVLMATASYMAFGILEYTNAIADWENLATRGLVGEAEKLAQIGSVISHVGDGQRLALLLTMCLLPAVLLVVSSTVYLKKYSLDEDRYEAIRKALEERR